MPEGVRPTGSEWSVGQSHELTLVGLAVPALEGLDLRQRLLATADPDDDVDVREEVLALVAPVAADDRTLVDREAVVLLGLGAGDAFGLPATADRLTVGEGGDAEVGETRDH